MQASPDSATGPPTGWWSCRQPIRCQANIYARLIYVYLLRIITISLIINNPPIRAKITNRWENRCQPSQLRSVSILFRRHRHNYIFYFLLTCKVQMATLVWKGVKWLSYIISVTAKIFNMSKRHHQHFQSLHEIASFGCKNTNMPIKLPWWNFSSSDTALY